MEISLRKLGFKADEDIEEYIDMVKEYSTELHSINSKYRIINRAEAMEWLLTPFTNYWFCIADGNIAGFSIIGYFQNCHYEADLYIEEFYIKPEYRRKGIGKKFAHSIIESNKNHIEKADNVCFFTMKGNDRAITFWKNVFSAWDLLPVPDTSNAPEHLVFNFYKRRIKM